MRLNITTPALIAANLLVIALALNSGIGLRDALWIYWMQSVIIGIFNYMRLRARRAELAIFFAVHYGGFHAGYALFMLIVPLICFVVPDCGFGAQANFAYILPLAAVFFINHWISFRHYEMQPNKDVSEAMLMLFPYARIFPMHLMIVLGAVFVAGPGGALLTLFLLMKTAADVVMHVIEHKIK